MFPRSNTSLSRLPAALLSPLLLSAALLSTSLAHAGPSESDRVTARALLVEGRKKLDAGDALGALDFFTKAHSIMHVPTTGLDVARAQEALGRLVEARATAVEVTQMPVMRGENQAFADARKAATEKIAQLDKRIPSLVLRIDGAPGEALVATIDAIRLPTAELSSPQKLNPGPHEIVIKAPEYPTVRRTVTLKDGEAEPVEVPVTLVSEAVVGPAGAPADMAWRRWAILGAGGAAVAGLGVGVGLNLAANAKLRDAQSQLDAMAKNTSTVYFVCGDHGDPKNAAGCTKLKDTLHANDALARGAVAGYVIGGVATAATVVFLVWPKLAPKRMGIQLTPMFGSSSGGALISGAF